MQQTIQAGTSRICHQLEVLLQNETPTLQITYFRGYGYCCLPQSVPRPHRRRGRHRPPTQRMPGPGPPQGFCGCCKRSATTTRYVRPRSSSTCGSSNTAWHPSGRRRPVWRSRRGRWSPRRRCWCWRPWLGRRHPAPRLTASAPRSGRPRVPAAAAVAPRNPGLHREPGARRGASNPSDGPRAGLLSRRPGAGRYRPPPNWPPAVLKASTSR